MNVPCFSCVGGPDCLPTDDINLMSLDSEVFPFVPNCPPGVDCFGSILGGGSISFPVCNQVLTRTVPPGSTQAEINLLIGELLTQAAQSAQFCGGPTINPNIPTQLYFNQPQSCTSFCPDGTPFTYTVPGGLIVSFDLGSANAAALNLACAKANALKICLSKIPTVFCVGTAMNVTIFATGTLSPAPFLDHWEMIDGTLPTGVTFNGGDNRTGRATLTGTPSTDGIYTFTIRVTTSNGTYQQKSYTICIIGIKPTSFPTFITGLPMSFTLTATPDCAIPPLSWQIVGGALPPGMTLNEQTGVVSGTPTGGFTTVTIQVQTEAT